MKNFTQNSIIIILAILFIHQCEDKKALQKTSKHNESVLLDSIQYYKNSLGQEVAEKKSFQGTAKELKQIFENEKQKSKQFEEAAKKWRKIANAYKIDLEIKHDSVDVPFDAPVKFNFSKEFYKKTELYTFSGTVNQNGINIDYLSTVTITPFTGVKNTGLFQSEIRSEITSSNKDVKIKDFTSFNFVPKKKIYEKWYVTIPIGIAAGLLIK